MSAIIFSGITGVDAPKVDLGDFKEYQRKCESYNIMLRAICKQNSKHKNVGEIIKFPVADGYALYMVFSMNPLELIHIPTMDGWHFEHAHLLTPERVTELIERDKRVAELFSKK